MAFPQKKDFPLKVLRLLEPYFDKKSGLYFLDEPKEGVLFMFKDTDPTSSFYFQIISYSVDTTGNVSFTIEHKPQSDYSLAIKKNIIDGSQIETHLNIWVGFLQSYQTQRSPYDQDFVLKQYEDEFFSEFELIDDDADTKSYNYNTQLKIDHFLDEVNIKLEEEKNNENKIEIEAIQNDITELKKQQTKLTKRIVFRSIGKIISKSRKYGLMFGKLVLETFIKSVAEAMTKMLFTGHPS